MVAGVTVNLAVLSVKGVLESGVGSSWMIYDSNNLTTFLWRIVICYIIIIIMKNYWQCKTGRGRLTPYQSADPSPTRPTNRGKEEKGKIVEDKKGERK